MLHLYYLVTNGIAVAEIDQVQTFRGNKTESSCGYANEKQRSEAGEPQLEGTGAYITCIFVLSEV